MCEYCQGDKFIIDGRKYDYRFDTCAGIDVHVEDGMLMVESVKMQGSYQEKETKINYCPMCGRKLTEDKE